jgi:transcriptional regulator with XRE-family HTH domain
MTFGERIRTNRIRHNMSQKQLAELLNVTPQTISKWDNDLSEPGFQMITEITSIFHMMSCLLGKQRFYIKDLSILHQKI